MNYGHPLRFGAFVTPSSVDPDGVVRLIHHCENVGLHLVAIQDHPYQPAHLDMWTLLTWAAGTTSEIRLVPDVLNTPLRPAAVAARAAASLDLLSGGRLDLALGAGAFWPQITAMGGTSRSGGEAINQLSESVDVFRAILGPGTSPIDLDGEFVTVRGIVPGPLPRHRIPIWLGGRRARSLHLIGQKGDGWIPSVFATDPTQSLDEIRRGNLAIDTSARAAQRDPADIRRLVNFSGRFGRDHDGFCSGPAGSWVDDLLPLAVEYGISTFILASDDPETLSTFAGSVVPDLRSAVDTSLSAPLPTSWPRSTSALAQRVPGIDYDAVPPELVELAVEPGDFDYARVRSTQQRAGAPGIVLRPRDAGEVAAAVGYAGSHRSVPLSVRSGGHGMGGRSTNHGGILIDLARLDTIEVVDHDSRRVRIGPGARWADVAIALASEHWALSSGDFGGVGVGGLAVNGGIGFLGRESGLTIDHLVAADVVLASGDAVRADAQVNPDLFWALRGAGANMGVVTAFEFVVDAVSDVGWAELTYDATDLATLLVGFGATAAGAPRDTTAFLHAYPSARGRPRTAQAMVMVDATDPAIVSARLQPFAALAPLYSAEAVIAPYAAIVGSAPDRDAVPSGRGEPISRSGFAVHLDQALARTLAQLIETGTSYSLGIRTVGGAIADVPDDATAYAHRHANFHIAARGLRVDQMDRIWDSLAPTLFGSYIGFDTDTRASRLAAAYPPATLRRLRAVKAHYDPRNLFRDNFTIAPLEKDAP